MNGRLALAAALVLLAAPALAEPTRVMVRAQAMDAKFIGDHTGGVQVTLTDARTGKVLSRGLIKGGTGDTGRIMKAPHGRYDRIADDQAAGFAAMLDIAEPTLVRIEGRGPLGKPASAVTVSSTLWVVPGHDVGGDGIVLTFPGLIVEPAATADAAGPVRVVAKVSPMCGCPIDAGGLWDAANYTVRASLMRKGRPVAETALVFTGKTGEFAGSLPRPAAGDYALRVVATDAKSPNAGVAEQPLRVPR